MQMIYNDIKDMSDQIIMLHNIKINLKLIKKIIYLMPFGLKLQSYMFILKLGKSFENIISTSCDFF